MPKMTAAERAELEARLRADDEAEDEPDHEFDYAEGDRSIRLPWSKRHQLADFGFKGGPKPAPEPKAGKGVDDPKTSKDGADDPPAGTSVTRFGRRVS